MEELLKRHDKKIVSFRRGQRIKANLAEITPGAVFFDLAGKSQAKLSGDNLDEVRDYIKTLKPGDEVWGVVMESEGKEGYVHISLRHAAAEAIWNRLVDAKEKGSEIKVVVRNVSDKGLTVELDSLVSFIPMSHVGADTQEEAEDLMDKHIKVKVLDVNRGKNRVNFSERAVSEAEEIEKYDKAMAKVKKGEHYKGVVSQTTGFGAFVEIRIDVDGEKIPVDGLVHITELSWDKVADTTSVVTEGDEVEVIALGNGDDGKLSLSMKQAQADPWEQVEKNYKVDSKHTGTVVRMSSFGAFVELEPGIEGLIHITKIPPSRELKKGDSVDVYVEEVDKNEKKIGLGLVLTTKPVGYK